jgi:hypothetical protein
MTDQPTGSLAEAVASWVLYYEANQAAARSRLDDMRANGVPDGHTGEKLGAFLALTPREHRCEHYGDDRWCTQCQIAQWDAEAEAKREQRATRRKRR